MSSQMIILHPMVQKALRFAAEAHDGQLRKGTKTPYITHPISAATILIEGGADVEEVVASILHDVDEDTKFTIEDIRREFGDRVARLVQGATEPEHDAPWEKRKQHTIDYLKTAPLDERRVSVADKLHNVLSMKLDIEWYGEEALWSRFKTGKEDQAWYYTHLAKAVFENLDEAEIPGFFHIFRDTVESVFGPF